MIVLEGPDNSGKSTLAKVLSEEFGLPVYHAGGPPASVKEMNKRVDFILNNHSKFIFDRIPLISEPVYCILRGGNNMFAESEELYSALREIKPIIIYCRPPLSVLMAEDNREAKSHDNPKHLKKVGDNKLLLIDRYDQVMNSEMVPNYLMYDYTIHSTKQLMEGIKHEMAKRAV